MRTGTLGITMPKPLKHTTRGPETLSEALPEGDRQQQKQEQHNNNMHSAAILSMWWISRGGYRGFLRFLEPPWNFPIIIFINAVFILGTA